MHKQGWQGLGAVMIAALLSLVAGPVAAQMPGGKDQPRAAQKGLPKSASRPQPAQPVVVMPPEVKRATPELARSKAAADQYCQAVLDPAREARFAHQAAELKALGKVLDDRLAKIDERIAELKEWVARREDFANRTSDQLVTIYSGMRPEAASEQLAKIEESAAAAILSKLAPRVASQILNDMPSDKAARLAMILMGAMRKSDPGGRS
jgi:flagellar motility protein MotE (MotC chaperone)